MGDTVFPFLLLWSESHLVVSDFGILQVRILEWVACPFSRGLSQPKDWTQVSHIAGSSWFLYWMCVHHFLQVPLISQDNFR